MAALRPSRGRSRMTRIEIQSSRRRNLRNVRDVSSFHVQGATERSTPSSYACSSPQRDAPPEPTPLRSNPYRPKARRGLPCLACRKAAGCADKEPSSASGGPAAVNRRRKRRHTPQQSKAAKLMPTIGTLGYVRPSRPSIVETARNSLSAGWSVALPHEINERSVIQGTSSGQDSTCVCMRKPRADDSRTRQIMEIQAGTPECANRARSAFSRESTTGGGCGRGHLAFDGRHAAKDPQMCSGRSEWREDPKIGTCRHRGFAE